MQSDVQVAYRLLNYTSSVTENRLSCQNDKTFMEIRLPYYREPMLSTSISTVVLPLANDSVNGS